MHTNVIIRSDQDFGQKLVERLLEAGGWTQPDPGALDFGGSSFLIDESGDCMIIKSQGGVLDSHFDMIAGMLVAISEIDDVEIVMSYSDPLADKVSRDSSDFWVNGALRFESGSVVVERVTMESWPYDLSPPGHSAYNATLEKLEV